MPDISLCPNNSCPLKETCYRSPSSGTVANDRWQTYTGFRYTDNQDGTYTCDDYDPVGIVHGLWRPSEKYLAWMKERKINKIEPRNR